MINSKRNGDKFIGFVKVWCGRLDGPPHWLMFVYAAATLFMFWFLINGLHFVFDIVTGG